MQTLTYNIGKSGYFYLYRGGIKEYPDKSLEQLSQWSDLGNDPYGRKRVRERGETYNLCDPLDDTCNAMSIAKGVFLYPQFNDYDHDQKARIAEFMGISDAYKRNAAGRLDVKLWCCFTVDGRVVLFKDGASPKRKEQTYKVYTQVVQEWTGMGKEWGKRNPKYKVKYWEFKHKSDYIIVNASDDLLFTVMPYIYESKLRHMRQKIQSACWLNCADGAKLMEKFANYLWKIEPFCLDESWDYTDEQKQYIKDVRAEIRRKELDRLAELERRRNTPGYCDDCGCECAEWVIDPFDYEMYGAKNYCWLCDDCYHERCMDI